MSYPFLPTPLINIFRLIVTVKVSDGQIAYIMHMTKTLILSLHCLSRVSSMTLFLSFSDIHKLMTVGKGDG